MSLRLRLLIATAVITLAALGTASAATYSILSSNLYHRLDGLMSASRSAFESAASRGITIDCARGPLLQRRRSGQVPPFLRPLHPGTLLSAQFVAVFDAAGHVIRGQRCPAYIGSKPYSPELDSVAALTSTLHGSRGPVYSTASASAPAGPRFLVALSRLPDDQLLVQGIAVTDTVNTLHELLIAEAVVSLGALAAALVVGWYLIRIGLRPLRRVSGTATSITSGNLDQRVAIASRNTEVGQLGIALNEMLDQIQGAFRQRDDSEDQLRQFVADASHELRTPIAAIAAYGELLNSGAGDDALELERSLGGIRREAARMGSLVEDLLVLARLDEGARGLRHPVELVRLCATAADAARQIAPEWPIAIVAASPVDVVGDEDQLHRSVANLLANVRQHTAAGTSTRVSVSLDDGRAVIEVRDDGLGMSEDAARHAFDRFYRGDPSRSRGRGGPGLGLAIVRSIVSAHGGVTSLSSGDDGLGTVVRIELPLADPSSGPLPPHDSEPLHRRFPEIA